MIRRIILSIMMFCWLANDFGQVSEIPLQLKGWNNILGHGDPAFYPEAYWMLKDNSQAVLRIRKDIPLNDPSAKNIQETWLLDCSGKQIRPLQFLCLDNALAVNDYVGDQAVIKLNDHTLYLDFSESHRHYSGCFFTIDLNTFFFTEGDWRNPPAGGPDVYPPYYSLEWDWQKLQGQGVNNLVAGVIKGIEKKADLKFKVIPFVPLSLPSEEILNCLSLGNCCLITDAANGFALKGNYSGPVYKILAFPGNELLIEIMGKHFEQGGQNWLNSDHLEIWERMKSDDPDIDLMNQPPGKLVCQWGIRLSDGWIFPAFNNPEKSPQVRIFRDPEKRQNLNSILVWVKLPYNILRESSLSVSYSQSDSGKNIRSLISTSRLVFGNEYTLSTVFQIDSSLVSVRINNNSMEWRRKYKIEKDKPMIDMSKLKSGIMPSGNKY